MPGVRELLEDLAGVQFWISELTSGHSTRDQLRQRFLVSTEFQARVQAVATAACAP